MKLFNQTFKSINEKQLVYKYIDYTMIYKKDGIEHLLGLLEGSQNSEDRLLYAFFKYPKENLKEHIEKSLSNRRLKDLLLKMDELVGESIGRIKCLFFPYFVGEDFDEDYFWSYDDQFFYKDDPLTWFEDIGGLKKEIVYLMEKFFEHNEMILQLEQYMPKSKFRILQRLIVMIVDGLAYGYIEDEMKIVHKYAVKYITIKHAKKDNLAALIVEFEYAFLMVADFIEFLYGRAFKRQEIRRWYENRDKLILEAKEEKSKSNEEKEPTKVLTDEEIEALLA